MLGDAGMTPGGIDQALDYLLTSQSVMLSTNQVMTVVGLMFIVAASIIWLAPRPRRIIAPGADGH